MANLEVIHEYDSIHMIKETGTEVNYYIFDEAEIHLNKIMPHNIQEWHFHKKIDENILITKGCLFRFVPNGIDKRELIKADKTVVKPKASVCR